MIKITSSQIQQWTVVDKKQSEQMLPELVRRLIASLCEVEDLHIPSGDSISNPWYDGIVNILSGNWFFPDWNCVIEIWTDHGIKAKADSDFIKRKADPKCNPKETNYVFVTSRLFSKSSDWAKEKSKEWFWKSVKAINSNDLEYLLDNSISSALWFNEILGQSNTFESIDSAWNKFSLVTEKKLTSDIVLSGRTTQVEKLLETVRLGSGKIEVKADSQLESFGFILSTLLSDASIRSKVIVVYNESDLDYITHQYKNLIIVPHFIPKNIGLALQQRHIVLFPNGKEWLKNIKMNASIELERMSREDRINWLLTILWKKDSAERLYADTRWYFYQLVRSPALGPNISSNPIWLDKFDKKLLHTILFLTEWEDAKDGILVSACLGEEYSKIRERLVQLSQCEDSPIRNIWGNVWQVISKSDLFTLLGESFDDTLVKNYEEIVIRTIADEDTSFDLEKKDRFMASVYDKWETYSGRVKQWICDSLCLLADIGDTSTQSYIDLVVGKIFASTHDPYKLIYNLGSNIRLLAEASPEIFLKYISSNIDWLAWLFDPWTNDFMRSRSEHVNLMWALEMLGWNPEYLPKVTDILIQLSDKYENQIQPNFSNRPMWSLTSLFIFWQRSTSATLEDKVAILRKLSENHPKIVFNLIVELLETTTATTPVEPNYRDWVDNDLWIVTNKEYYDFAFSCIDLLINLFELDVKRSYITMLDIINKFSLDRQNIILDIFLRNDFKDEIDQDLLEARKKIREIFMRESLYEEKVYGDVDKIMQVYALLKPHNPLLERAYVFGWGYGVFVIERKGDYKKTDFDVQEKIAKEERTKTFIDIYTTFWINWIKELIPFLEMPWGLAGAITNSWIFDQKLYNEIFSLLNEDNPQLFTFGINFLNDLSRNKDANFLNTVEHLEDIVSEKILARFILSMEDPNIKFSLLRKQSEIVQEIFWKDLEIVNWWWILRDDGYSEANYVLTELNKRWLFNISLEVLSRISHSHRLDDVDTKIIFDIFKWLVWYINSGKRVTNIEHHIKEILTYLYSLEKNWKPISGEIRWLEIQYIKTLDNPLMINKALAEKPEFLVEMIIQVYKARNEESRIISDEEQKIASNVWHILHHFSRIPGTQDNGSIDEEFLTNYITKAIELLEACDRLEIWSQKIWEVLAHSPIGKDLVWPCEAVRNVIDKFNSEPIIRGFDVGKSNLRGTTMRWMFDWWDQERELAKRYLDWADKLNISNPITANALRWLWKSYQQQAEREDISAELDRG